MRCESIPGDKNEAIVYDKYRFEIVELAKLASDNGGSTTHRSRSKSPLPHMSGLGKILAIRDSIVHVTYANDIVTVLTHQD
jgi:hypothetical protein